MSPTPLPRAGLPIRRTWIAAAVAITVVLLVPAIFTLDGKPHADWLQFLGRFHPLAVHLPIGLILLIPLFELAAKFRSPLHDAATLLLLLAVPACLLSLILGLLLAYGSGTSGSGVQTHMWAGIWLTITVLLCLLTRPAWTSGSLPYAYPILLLCALLLVAWTGHLGGSLVYGRNYLVEFAPSPIKTIARAKVAEPTPPGTSFYTEHIQPILDGNCVSCHGQSNVKGGLRLDTYDLVLKGGTTGAVIVAGKPEQSLLLTRITLPPADKHFMPSDGKPPLKAEEIAWIKAWIADGASSTAASITGVTIAAGKKEPVPQVGDYSKLHAQIEQLAKQQGIQIIAVSRNPGDGLILNAVDAGRSYGDQQLAQLAPMAPFIVEAELARTGVTDAAFDSLAKFAHLRALHLEDTAVTGTALARLKPLTELTYLNLSGTSVTQNALAPITSMNNLHHVYLYNTPAQPPPPPPPAPPPLEPIKKAAP